MNTVLNSFFKDHKRDGSVWARNLIYQPGVSDAPLVKEKEPG
jgi:hypothetical protein